VVLDFDFQVRCGKRLEFVREGLLDRGVDLEQLGQAGDLQRVQNRWRQAGELLAALPAAQVAVDGSCGFTGLTLNVVRPALLPSATPR
jgi:hypothetical protein